MVANRTGNIVFLRKFMVEGFIMSGMSITNILDNLNDRNHPGANFFEKANLFFFFQIRDEW